MVRRILERQDELLPAIATTIREAVGADKKALEATIIVGLLQALQGDKDWAKLLLDRGYGSRPGDGCFDARLIFGAIYIVVMFIALTIGPRPIH